ncbi:MAG: SAM-dependent methyltransferase [Anaerolineae bacterium]|nr:SAM-dependent methyltransferase [Anaerolineae bacterium]
MTESKIEREGSSTSGYTCFSRACATREKDERFRGPDYLAELFMPPIPNILLNIPILRKLCMGKLFPTGIHEYVLARTRAFDEAFVNALDDGISQIVVLGAGMDTRALRFQDRNKGTMIFELDIHATQHYKREVLERKKVVLPPELVFVPIDFNKQRLADVLIEAGYQQGQKTLFLWEGVTMYLEAEAVDGTLAFIRTGVAEGSVVVFDYVRASVLRYENTLYGEDDIRGTVARAEEGWIYGIEDGAIEDFLAERGFKLLSHYLPSDLEAAYLTADDGTRFGRINETHCILIAGL